MTPSRCRIRVWAYSRVASTTARRGRQLRLPEPDAETRVSVVERATARHAMNEGIMAKIEKVDGQSRIVETPTEARQAEPGPSVLALLTISTVAAVFVLAIIWFVFFRT